MLVYQGVSMIKSVVAKGGGSCRGDFSLKIQDWKMTFPEKGPGIFSRAMLISQECIYLQN